MPTVLITGGHGGIGFECAKRLATQGFDLVLAGRSPELMGLAALRISTDYGVQAATLELDTSSLGSVRCAAARVGQMLDTGEIESLQAILCNAGATFRGAEAYTDEGFERTFATNYLGHFLLVQLLLDHISTTGRIIFTASGTHDPDTMDGKFIGRAVYPDAIALAYAGRDGKATIPDGKRYTTSKLCTVLHAYELDRRLRASSNAIASIAYDPGAIATTGLLRDLPGPARAIIASRPVRWLMGRMGLTMGDLALSGIALADLAVSATFDNQSGRYFQWSSGSLKERRSARISYDRAIAEKLWADSKALVALQPDEEPKALG